MKNAWTIGVALALVTACNVSAKNCIECHRTALTGADLSAWKSDTGLWENVGDAFLNPDDAKLLATHRGAGTVINGPAGRTKHLFSKEKYGDVRAHLEFKVAKDSNSGVYFMGRYEVQVFDSWQKPSDYPGIECGGIYRRWNENREPKGFEGHSPRVNASYAPGQWQSFDVVFRAPRFAADGHKIANARFEKVVHNGVIIHEDVELTGPTRASAFNDENPLGPLMLQGDHGPVAYRNITLSPAGANPFFAMDTATKDAEHQTATEQTEMLKELGYDGIGVTLASSESLAELLSELDKRELRLFAVYTGVNLDPDKPPYDPTLKEAIKTLGGRNIILWLFVQSSQHKPSVRAGDVRAAEIVGELADLAAEHNVRISLYPHHGFWLERFEDAVRVAGEVDRKNVGATFNLCHWLKVEGPTDPGPTLEAAKDRLSVVNINGADTDGKDWNTLIQTLDRGTFDINGFLKTLGRIGYTGPIGFQGYGIGGDVYENLKNTMQAWEKHSRVLWSALEPFDLKAN